MYSRVPPAAYRRRVRAACGRAGRIGRLRPVRVVSLWRYPVKSMGGEQLSTAEVGASGIDGDRHWAVLDVGTGKILTARREPELLFAAARLRPDGQVAITLPDGSDGTSDVALSAWLGRPVQLQEAGPDQKGTYETPIDFEHEAESPWLAWEGPAGTFHDSGRTQVSLVSLTTLRHWDVRRFRPNIVVDGDGEDGWIGSSLTVGGVVLDVVKPVDRCVITTRQQPGGIERDLDVLRTINRERAGNLAVGALVQTPGRAAVGDLVNAAT